GRKGRPARARDAAGFHHADREGRGVPQPRKPDDVSVRAQPRRARRDGIPQRQRSAGRGRIVAQDGQGRGAPCPPTNYYSPPWSPPPQRSDIASMKAETTNARCTPTSQASLVGSKLVSMFMKAFSTWIAEIATIEAISFCLSPPKLTLVIHSGQSGWLPGSILETKFS